MEIGNVACTNEVYPTPGRLVNATIEERLLRRKDELERDLKEVNEALDALQANPEILRVMSLISKVRY